MCNSAYCLLHVNIEPTDLLLGRKAFTEQEISNRKYDIHYDAAAFERAQKRVDQCERELQALNPPLPAPILESNSPPDSDADSSDDDDAFVKIAPSPSSEWPNEPVPSGEWRVVDSRDLEWK